MNEQAAVEARGCADEVAFAPRCRRLYGWHHHGRHFHDRRRHHGWRQRRRRRWRRWRRSIRDETGGVAAEFAVTLPAVLLVLAAAVGVLHAQAQRVVLQDAAADAARLVARGDDPQRAASLVSAAVDGARLDVELEDDLVCAVATATLAVLPTLTVDVQARACALGGGR